MASWSFLTNHARVLLCIAHDPGMRLRDIATSVGITERSAYGIVTDLAEAGYVVKEKDGRRNRYQIQAHLPMRDRISQEPAIGEVLALLTRARSGGSEPGPAAAAEQVGAQQVAAGQLAAGQLAAGQLAAGQLAAQQAGG